ncbi:MAG: hypothetical protein HYY21_01995 [Candidatus Tectomicrobia bacterium]|nr:hypothetical protein [Candidatus Tectomicrobia bacterium]
MESTWQEILQRMDALAARWAGERQGIERLEELLRWLREEACARIEGIQSRREDLTQRAERARRSREALLDRRAEYVQAIQTVDEHLRQMELIMRKLQDLVQKLKEEERRVLEDILSGLGRLDGSARASRTSEAAPAPPPGSDEEDRPAEPVRPREVPGAAQSREPAQVPSAPRGEDDRSAEEPASSSPPREAPISLEKLLSQYVERGF